MLTNELYGSLLAIISSFFWAAGATIYKKGLETTDIWSGNFMRTGFTAIGFFILMLVNGSFLSSLLTLNPVLIFWMFVSAFFAFFAGDLLYLASLNEIGVSRAVPVSSTYPLFVALWAFLVYNRNPTPLLIAGTVVIIIAIKLISENGESRESKKGIMLAILAAVCWSVSIAILEYLTLYLPSEAVAGFRFAIASLLVVGIASKKGFVFNRHSAIWIGIGGMIVLVVSNYAFVEAIRLAGSAKVAPISSTYPVISAFFASTILREKLTVKIIAGTLLSFLGVLMVILG